MKALQKSTRNTILWVFISLVYIVGVPTTQAESKIQKPAPILFIVDASGSMTEIFKGVPRMVAARVMLFEKIKTMNANVPVGLVAYGNRIPGCRSHRIYATIRTKNRQTLVEQIKKLYPAGATPLGNTLRMVGTRLLPYYPGARVVIISDGAESCGGDPVREIQKIRRRGYKVTINVIGLDVDRITAIQLGAMARAGNGKYFDVKNHSDFSNAISQSTASSLPNQITQIEQPKKIRQNKSLLEITKVYQAQNANGEMVWKVKYQFQNSRHGNYYILIKALKKPAIEGSGGSIPGNKHFIKSVGDSFYSIKNGNGELEINMREAPKTNYSPFYLQGELWDTSSIPIPLYISNFKIARD